MSKPQTSPLSSTQATPTFRGRLARRMVLLLVPAVLIPVIIIGLIASMRSQQAIKEQTASQLQQAETEMQYSINDWLLSKSARIDAVAHHQAFIRDAHILLTTRHYDPNFKPAQQRIVEALGEINSRETHPIFNAFFVLSDDYGILASSEPAWTGLQISGSPLAKVVEQMVPRGELPTEGYEWFGKIAPRNRAFEPDAFGGVHVLMYGFSPLPSSDKQALLFTIVAYADRKSGKRMYIVGVSEEVALQQLLQQLADRYPDSQAYFLLYDGTYLSISPHSHTLTAYTAPPIFKQSFQEQNNFFLEGEYTSPVKNIPSFSMARWVPSLNAAIGLEIPSELFYQRARKLAPLFLHLIGIMAVLLALIIWFVSNRITRPILEIADAARRFAEGDWRVRSPITRNDEIGLLAYAFNKMADELSNFYRSLEAQVEERTRQIRTAAEVAALATSTTDLSEILRRTVDLIVEHFPQYYHASVFLIEEGNKAVLAESTGPVGETMKRQRHTLEVGSASVVGWAAAHREPRVASDVTDDPVHFKNPLLPETRSEAGIPLLVGNQVLGVLDVQSKNPHAFDEQSVATLQTLAGQLAAAIYNARLREQAEMGLGETQTLYEISRKLASAQTPEALLRIAKEAMASLPYISAMYVRSSEDGFFHLARAHHPQKGEISFTASAISLPSEVLQRYLPAHTPLVLNDIQQATLPDPLLQVGRAMGCRAAVFLPFYVEERLEAIFVLGSEQPRVFTSARVHPYATLTEIGSVTFQRLVALIRAQRQMRQLEAVVRLAQAVGETTDPGEFYKTLHKEIEAIFGEVGFIVALYDPLRRMITIPYAYEQGEETLLDLPPFPLGEGLVSRVITSRRSLLLSEDVERRAREMGAKIVGKPARSWLGVPLISGERLLGALILQDTQRSGRFRERDLNFVETLASAVALLLDKMRVLRQAETLYQREHALFQISETSRQAASFTQALEAAAATLRQTLAAHRVVLRLNLGALKTRDKVDSEGGEG